MITLNFRGATLELAPPNPEQLRALTGLHVSADSPAYEQFLAVYHAGAQASVDLISLGIDYAIAIEEKGAAVHSGEVITFLKRPGEADAQADEVGADWSTVPGVTEIGYGPSPLMAAYDGWARENPALAQELLSGGAFLASDEMDMREISGPPDFDFSMPARDLMSAHVSEFKKIIFEQAAPFAWAKGLVEKDKPLPEGTRFRVHSNNALDQTLAVGVYLPVAATEPAPAWKSPARCFAGLPPATD